MRRFAPLYVSCSCRLWSPLASDGHHAGLRSTLIEGWGQAQPVSHH